MMSRFILDARRASSESSPPTTFLLDTTTEQEAASISCPILNAEQQSEDTQAQQ